MLTILPGSCEVRGARVGIVALAHALEATEERVAGDIGVVSEMVLLSEQPPREVVEAAPDRCLLDIRVADVPLAAHVGIVACDQYDIISARSKIRRFLVL